MVLLILLLRSFWLSWKAYTVVINHNTIKHSLLKTNTYYQYLEYFLCKIKCGLQLTKGIYPSSKLYHGHRLQHGRIMLLALWLVKFINCNFLNQVLLLLCQLTARLSSQYQYESASNWTCDHYPITVKIREIR